MDVAVVVIAALGGIVVGSFVNAALLRWLGWRVVLPQLTGTVATRAVLRRCPPRCSTCEAPLAPGALPAVAYVVGLGRCRGRERHRLATRYLMVELVLGGLWAGAAVKYGDDLRLLPVLVLFTGLVAMSAIDVWVMRIPNRFVYGTHAVLIPTLVVVSLVEDIPGALAGAAVGGIAYFAFLFLFHLVSPRRMGFGDVRLAGIMGLALGWVGWRPDLWITSPLVWMIWGALIGSLLGTFAGIATVIAARRNRPFPFGPALAAGCVAIVLFGSDFGLPSCDDVPDRVVQPTTAPGAPPVIVDTPC